MSNTILILIIICGIILLGCLNNVYHILQVKRKVKFCDEYLTHADNCLKKLQKNPDDSSEFGYILMNREKMSKYISESLYNNPSFDLVNYIKKGDFTYLSNLHNILYQIECKYLEQCGRFNRDIQQYLNRFLNPFTLFYLGIEGITRIVFGYLLQFLKPDFDFEGRAWKVTNAILSVLGSVASMVGLYVTLYKG